MKIRKPKTTDKEQVMEILKQMSPEYMTDMLSELDRVTSNKFDGKHFGFVYEDGKDVIGYITCRENVATYQLETLAVHPSHQRKNIGSNLVNFLIQYLKYNGRFKVLNVNTEHGDYAEEFYIRSGFEISGVIKDEFIPGIEQVHLSYRL